MKRFILIAVAALCCLGTDVKAASLFGKVIDVSSGDVITVFNLNRPVRVRLIAVDAPEMNQEFGDVAKKHLADLVHDKFVLVEYSGIAADRSVSGRVLLDKTDVGVQMIRDGVAWFDPNDLSRLSAQDREIYQQSEQAARSERRGLWQAESPMAPWEFVKTEALMKNPYAKRNWKLPESKRRSNAPAPELSNLTLIPEKKATRPGPVSRDEINAAWKSLTPTPKSWEELRPAGQNFSVLVPEEGRLITAPLQGRSGPVDLNMHIARDGASVFVVLWMTGPTFGETDQTAIKDMVLEAFIKSFHKGYEQADGGEFTCPLQREKNISTMGYTGIEYDLSSCTLSTRARAFTQVIGDQRQMYFGIIFYGDEDETVSRFIKSFKVGPAPQAKNRRRS